MDELGRIHGLQVYAAVLLSLTVALGAGVATAVYAVLKYGAVA